MAKVVVKPGPKVKAKVKPKPKGVTRQTDPFTGRSVPHSKAYWAARNRAYESKYGPLNLTGPMSPSDVAKAIDAATNTKFGPQEQTIGKQQAASATQDKNISSWYDTYRQQLNQATQANQAATQQAQNFTNNFANSSSVLDAQQRSQQAQQSQQQAGQTGAAVDPNQAFIGQQADQSRRQNIGQFGALQATQAVNQGNFLEGKKAIGTQAEIGAHTVEATRRQALLDQLKALQSQKGDYRTTVRGQLQASERQNQLAIATLTGNQANAAAKTASTAATAAANRAQSNTNNQRTTRTSAQNNRASTQQSDTNNRRTTQQSDTNSRRTAANRRAAARRRAAPYHGHTPSYQTAYKNAYNFLFNHPVYTRSPLYDLDQLIAKVRKATGADYAAAYDAAVAARKKYPVLQGTGGSQNVA